MSRKNERKKCRGRRAAALFLAVLLVVSPCFSLLWGNITARAESFTIKKLKDNSMIKDGNFTFYGSRMKAELFYWIKNDGSPLFCIQKTASLIPGLNGGETIEEFGSSQYLDEKKYELVSLVLQCCGMIKGESPVLEPGTYLAGQAAVWGITSANWTNTQRFRREMENVYDHIGNWYDVPKEEIISKSREAVENICQAIDDYYGDKSPYIPSFASKYENHAPVWNTEREEDGSCEIAFELDGKAEAIKEFVFQLPEGWSYEWQEDRIIFRGENTEEGLISITGKAGEGSILEEAMPIGLVYIVGPSSFPSFQRLASDVELKTVWSCYFKLLVSEPEDPGNWYLPEVHCYRHQETFKSIYGTGIEKLDGDTQEPISGVEFQPLEYFDSRQMEDSVLDKQQITAWTGWKERCAPLITGQDGKLEHWDEHEYLYEKTYCSGHPAPEITYSGSSERRREQLEAEAEEAWESAVEECGNRCDFHRIDGTGQECLEADRDLAYQQFIHLVYGYTFRETKPAEGYLPYGEQEQDKQIGPVFLTSLQAGGERQESEGTVSAHYLNRTRTLTIRKIAGSNTELKFAESKEETASKSDAERAVNKSNAEENVNKSGAEEIVNKSGAGGTASKSNAEETEKMVSNKIKSVRKDISVWLTSLVPFLEQQTPDMDSLYEFTVKNYKVKEPPEETTPEETTPEETPPEETTPEETPPEETPPEETLPEETLPEETPPEETLPEETPPEETPPEETLPEETLPEETPPEETTPEETTPEETLSSTVTPSKPLRPPGGSGGGNRKSLQLFVPSETQPFIFLTEDLVPQAGARMGWITAEYATPSAAQRKKGKNGDSSVSMPGTGDRGSGMMVLCLAAAVSGSISFWMIKRRKRKGQGTPLISLFLIIPACLVINVWEAQAADGKEYSLSGQEENKRVVYYSDEEVSRDEGGIPEIITDESGQIYILESCRQVVQSVPEKEEWISEIVEYTAVEHEEQIPERVIFQGEDEDTERKGEGELVRADCVSADFYWTEDFRLPLTFYDYDAQGYRLKEMEVPGDGALMYLMEHQQSFLEALNLPPDCYQVETIIWSGDSYPFADMLCRDAQVLGRKRVSDRAVRYSGNVVYPETEMERWEAVYVPQILVNIQESSAPEMVLEERVLEERRTEELPSLPKNNFFWLRRVAVYTVSFAVLFPIVLYLVLLVRKGIKKKGNK